MAMLKKWLGGKERRVAEETLWSPVSGKVIRLEDVPDPTFSKSAATPGIAVEPAEGKVYSPVDGEILWLFETKHAVCIRGRSGVEIIIHIGLDTVSMRGEGFHAVVRNGDRVQAGELLIEFSLEQVARQATSTITPILIINPDRMGHFELYPLLYADARRTPLMKIQMRP